MFRCATLLLWLTSVYQLADKVLPSFCIVKRIDEAKTSCCFVWIIVQEALQKNFKAWTSVFECFMKAFIAFSHSCKEMYSRTLAVVQWLRIRLPMQGMWVWSLVQEDSTCHRATKPMHQNFWTCTLEPTGCNFWSPSTLQPVYCN